MAIAPDTASNILIALVNKRHVFDFATYLRGQWESIPEPEAFVISDSLYTAFEQFLQGKDYEYITESDKLLKDFKEKATKEKYFDAVAKEYEALVARKQTDKSKDLRKHRREISEYLKQEIVARYYFQKGRLRATFAGIPRSKGPCLCLRILPRTSRFYGYLDMEDWALLVGLGMVAGLVGGLFGVGEGLFTCLC